MRTLLFALGASVPLLVGGALGAWWKPPDQVVAVALAFAAGALLSAVSFDLFADAVRSGGQQRTALGFAAGAIVFVVIDTFLDRRVERGATGYALLAAVTLDGVPENAALGVSLIDGGSLALLAAVFASNVPESLAGAVNMREQGRSRTAVVALWGAAAALLAAAVVAGRLVFSGAEPAALALPLAFAGGAVLASVLDTLAPEAFRQGGPWIALASAAGYVMTFALSG